jgi:hypothetical protein
VLSSYSTAQHSTVCTLCIYLFLTYRLTHQLVSLFRSYVLCHIHVHYHCLTITMPPRQRALQRHSEWKKSDLLDIIFWLRISIALLCGSIWGALQLTGFQGIILYISLTILLVQVYYLHYLYIDDEEYGKFDLMTEGFVPSFALFILTWSTLYSLQQKEI